MFSYILCSCMGRKMFSYRVCTCMRLLFVKLASPGSNPFGDLHCPGVSEKLRTTSSVYQAIANAAF